MDVLQTTGDLYPLTVHYEKVVVRNEYGSSGGHRLDIIGTGDACLEICLPHENLHHGSRMDRRGADGGCKKRFTRRHNEAMPICREEEGWTVSNAIGHLPDNFPPRNQIYSFHLQAPPSVQVNYRSSHNNHSNLTNNTEDFSPPLGGSRGVDKKNLKKLVSII